MTNKTVQGRVAFATILATAACAFAGVTNETQLDNVNWNQTSPWEDYLPKGESDNASSGCVPTAYAQLMAYHEWPAIIDDTVLGHAPSVSVREPNRYGTPRPPRAMRPSAVRWAYM